MNKAYMFKEWGMDQQASFVDVFEFFTKNMPTKITLTGKEIRAVFEYGTVVFRGMSDTFDYDRLDFLIQQCSSRYIRIQAEMGDKGSQRRYMDV